MSRGSDSKTLTMRTVNLPSGERVPVLGQGTWQMADKARTRKGEIAALQLGIDLGMTLIDTAEMYADGDAEELVAEAIDRRRDDVFLVSKVLPSNATEAGTIEACERSLARLDTDRIDLYLLHWRGAAPLRETVAAFKKLRKAGKIRYWGVSNLDSDEMQELVELDGGDQAVTDQVLYNLTRRGIEHDLMPWCRERSMPIMAYSPIEQGRMLKHKALRDVAAKHAATPAQVALAWLIGQDGVIAIPKAGSAAHVRENFKALDLKLTADDLAALDRAFPRPQTPRALEML